MFKTFFVLFCLVVALTGCTETDKNGQPLDTPTAGHITIASDGSFRPIVEAEIDVFEGIYKNAKIDAEWLPENKAIQELVKGNVRLAVVSRDFTEAEKEVIRSQKYTPRPPITIAVDGVALIVNKQNPDSMLTMDQVRSIFKGQAKQWAELGKGGAKEDIVIVFDNNNSSNLNFVLRTFSLQDLQHLNVFAAESNEQVIEYVKDHENAMGVIGAGWISDLEDPSDQKFLQSISVVALADTTNPTEDDYYQPYQAYLALKKYPLRRDVLILSREARAGLGSGFTTHIASDRGQRIILKSGLLPVTMPVRIVEIRKNF